MVKGGMGKVSALYCGRRKRGYKPKIAKIPALRLKICDSLTLKSQTVREICKNAGMVRRKGRNCYDFFVYDYLNGLVEIELLIKEGKGGYKEPYTYRINPKCEYKCVLNGFYEPYKNINAEEMLRRLNE